MSVARVVAVADTEIIARLQLVWLKSHSRFVKVSEPLRDRSRCTEIQAR